MRVVLKRIVFGILLLQTGLLNAQDYPADMKKIYKFYLSNSFFYAKMNVKVFRTNTGNDVLLSKKGLIVKSNTNYMLKLDGILTVFNKDVVLVKNEERKEISYAIKDTASDAFYQKQILPDILDSLRKFSDSIVYNGTNGFTKKYTVYSSLSIIKKMVIEFDSRYYYLTKLTYYYKETNVFKYQRVTISYSDISLKRKFLSSDFDTKNYIVFKDNQVKANPRYKDYTVTFINTDGDKIGF